jgi:hypothetical protein
VIVAILDEPQLEAETRRGKKRATNDVATMTEHDHRFLNAHVLERAKHANE